MREKVAVGRMRGCYKLTNFLAFPFTKSAHPPLAWSPLSQLGEGFQCIDFIYQIDLFDVNQPLASLPSPWGRRWLKAGWGDSYKYLIFIIFFSSNQIPHPPLAWSPLSQLGEGFQCIDFIYQIDLFSVNQSLATLPSPEGEGGRKPDEGAPANI